MSLLIVSLIAGALTVLAPCVLAVLPVIIGGSLSDHERRNPLIITASLAASIVIFTLILKSSTYLIAIPDRAWSAVSGFIIIGFGLVTIFPDIWEKISIKLRLGSSAVILEKSAKRGGRLGDVLLGAALGPVFSSCSPTYFVILATVLPANFVTGLIYLAAYAAGLGLMLLLISWLGQRLIKKLRWAADPRSAFKRGLGVMFVLVGLFVLLGGDKVAQSYLVERGYFFSGSIERRLLK